MKKNIPSVLAVVLLSTFPVFFLYFNNAAEMSFSEVWLPLGIYLGVGLVLFGLSLAVVRSVPKAAVIAGVFMLLFANYTLLQTGIQKLLPNLGYQHILPILLFIVLHIGYWIKKKLSADVAATISLVLAIAFGGLIAFNAFTAIPAIAQTVSTEQPGGAVAELPEGDAAATRPNFYFFIFDEYSNFDIIEKYYGYDNSAFGKTLEELGFTVSYDSVNESQQTPTILANLFTLEYAVEDGDLAIVKESARKNSVLQQTLEVNGYELRGLGQAFEYMNIPKLSGENASAANRATTMGGASFTTTLLENTPIAPFLNTSDGNAERELLHETVDYFKNPASFEKTNNIGTITYLKMPHQPFVFTADGGENDLLNWHNWTDPQQYLGQFIYTTTVMQEMVESIVANDPNSVVVLMSDHSARSMQNAQGEILIDKFDRRHFFNAVYYGGQPLPEIEGMSGVNTLRIVLSKLLKQDYPVIEEVPVSEFEF